MKIRALIATLLFPCVALGAMRCDKPAPVPCAPFQKAATQTAFHATIRTI